MTRSGEPGNVRGDGADVELATPRSTVWQGFLGTASVVAYALLFELARNLVVNSFGENTAVQVLGGTLRWISVLLVLAAGVYVAHRVFRNIREKVRAQRELDLLADLVEPGPPVGAGEPPPAPAPPRRVPELNGDEIAAVLRELPVRVYDTATLLAVLEAVQDAPLRLPADRVPAPRAAATVLTDLHRRGVVTTLGAQRYCVRRVPLVPVRATVTGGPLWRAALTALVRHRAEEATRWAVGLESLRFAEGATRWFRSAETSLCELISACATLAPAELPGQAIPELAGLADALDVWYARIGKAENASGLATDLCELRGIDAHPLHREVSRMRADRLTRRPQTFRPRRLSTSLAARWEHRGALRVLTVASDDLAAAESRLEAAWWRLPREDVAGEVCALVNLAVVHLRQGRLDAAQDRLGLAESLTRGGRDPGGRAHAHELTGVLWWARGEPRRALRCWQLALTGYRALFDDHGIARCLQHLGSAVVIAPEHGGLLLGAEPPLTRREVLRQAGGWLAEATRRHPALRYADLYAAQVDSELRRDRPARRLPWRRGVPGALTAVDRWPLPAHDPVFGAGQ